jgi:hypothetical protein
MATLSSSNHVKVFVLRYGLRRGTQSNPLGFDEDGYPLRQTTIFCKSYAQVVAFLKAKAITSKYTLKIKNVRIDEHRDS